MICPYHPTSYYILSFKLSYIPIYSPQVIQPPSIHPLLSDKSGLHIDKKIVVLSISQWLPCPLATWNLLFGMANLLNLVKNLYSCNPSYPVVLANLQCMLLLCQCPCLKTTEASYVLAPTNHDPVQSPTYLSPNSLYILQVQTYK